MRQRQHRDVRHAGHPLDPPRAGRQDDIRGVGVAGQEPVDPAVDLGHDPPVRVGVTLPPEAVVVEPSAGEPLQAAERLMDQRGVVEQPPDGEHAAVGGQRHLAVLLGLEPDELGRGAEQVALDRPRRPVVAQEAAGLGQGRLVADQRVGDRQVQRDVDAARPVPLAGAVAAAVGGREVGRLEEFGLAGLVVVRRVGGIDLGEPEDEHARQPRQRRVARAGGLLVMADGRVQGGLGQELARLVVALRGQVEALLGVELLLVGDRVIGVFVEDARPDLDDLLGDLLVLVLGGELVVGDGRAAVPAGDDVGLADRPGERVVGLGRVAGRASAGAEPGLDRDEVGHGLRVERQQGLRVGVGPEPRLPVVGQAELGERPLAARRPGTGREAPDGEGGQADQDGPDAAGERRGGSLARSMHGVGSIPSISGPIPGRPPDDRGPAAPGPVQWSGSRVSSASRRPVASWYSPTSPTVSPSATFSPWRWSFASASLRVAMRLAGEAVVLQLAARAVAPGGGHLEDRRLAAVRRRAGGLVTEGRLFHETSPFPGRRCGIGLTRWRPSP